MSIYDQLIQFKNNYPALTFDNHGYEYLSKEVKESHKEQIQSIEAILKEQIGGFSRFDNFKPRKDGSFAIRCQYNYNFGKNECSFIGVGYFGINLFKDL